MAKFTVGQQVRIRENAFTGSPEQRDIEARGKVGVVVYDLAQEYSPEWGGCYIVQLDNGDNYNVIAGEIEAA